jgi:hypothetical protein
MSLELVSILTVMGRAGIGMSLPMIVFFVTLAVGFTTLLWFCFFPRKKEHMGSRTVSSQDLREEVRIR